MRPGDRVRVLGGGPELAGRRGVVAEVTIRRVHGRSKPTVWVWVRLDGADAWAADPLSFAPHEVEWVSPPSPAPATHDTEAR